MNGIRLLSGLVAFTVVLLEVYSGLIQGPLWWVVPGGLVLALLIALSLHTQEMAGMQATGVAPMQNSATNVVSNILQWSMIVVVAFGVSYIANYLGSDFFPSELEKIHGWTPPTDWPPVRGQPQ